ncbi:MAG: hypothetical protein LQ343_005525 [Gyalolechia ehrenbergii]|nr:MAG: hypothetical protein LQ343_005525 [Gyalolechia ehrenbergii]
MRTKHIPDVAGLALPSLRPRARHEKEISYRVPGTDTSLELLIYLDQPLSPGAVRDLLSRSLMEVNFILDIAGDGPVPMQEYDKEIKGTGRKVRVDIFGGDATRELLTYDIVKDTLIGFWNQMVTNRLAFRTYAIVVHGSLGIVAHAMISPLSHVGEIADA